MSDLTTPKDLLAEARNLTVSRALIATDLFAGKFYATSKEAAVPAPTTDAAKRAEAMFNDPKSTVYGDAKFAALTKALTNEDIRFTRNSNRTVEFVQPGVVVVPVTPVYGERADDGYGDGGPVFVTNRTNGKGRNTSNLDKRINDVQPLSRNSSDWRPATQEEIEPLVDALLTKYGVKFLTDMNGEFETIDELLAQISG